MKNHKKIKVLFSSLCRWWCRLVGLSVHLRGYLHQLCQYCEIQNTALASSLEIWLQAWRRSRNWLTSAEKRGNQSCFDWTEMWTYKGINNFHFQNISWSFLEHFHAYCLFIFLLFHRNCRFSVLQRQWKEQCFHTIQRKMASYYWIRKVWKWGC